VLDSGSNMYNRELEVELKLNDSIFSSSTFSLE